MEHHSCISGKVINRANEGPLSRIPIYFSYCVAPDSRCSPSFSLIPFQAFRNRLPPDMADALGIDPIAVRAFEVQAAFAMTFNKLQGATMDSLVVVMTDLKGLMVGNHTAAKAGVAFTRVKHSRTLGIFPCEDGELDHLLELQHPGWLRAWARNYDEDGFWRRDRLPIDPVALDFYKDWKDANPHNPTSGVVVKDLLKVTKAACLPTRIKAPCGKTKSGFKPRPMRRAELVSQLARVYPQFDEELARSSHPASEPALLPRQLHSNKRKRATTTTQLSPHPVAKTSAAASLSSPPAHATDALVASAPQPRKFPPCPHCSNASCHSGKCV